MELNTKCPQCDTVFPVTLEQLQLRKGFIRCVQCAHIFDGFEAVVPATTSQREPSIPASSTPTSPQAPSPDEHSDRSMSEFTVGESEPNPELNTEPRAPTVAPEPEPDRPIPRFVIPDVPPVRPNARTAAKPFSFGGDAASESPVSNAPFEPLGPREPRLPSVVRQREEIRHRGTPAAPSFTISDRRPAGSRRDGEHVIGARAHAGIAEPSLPVEPDTDKAPTFSSYTDTAPEPAIETDNSDYLFVEPRPQNRSERYQPTPFDGTPKRRPWMTPVWGVLIVLGLLLLLGQGVYVYRAQLANTFPGLRPALEAACANLSCTVPYERHIDTIAITGSALRSSGAPEDDVSSLTLEVTLRNTHVRPQEWPTLVLDLKDASGAIVVRRNLPPAAWVPPDVRTGPFAAGAEITVQVPLTVKGVQANGYQLDKFFP